MPKKTLTADVVITMDDEFNLYEPGYVVIEEGRILEVGDKEPAHDRGGERVDLGNRLLMPGLVNAHAHTPMVIMRGMCEGVSLFTMTGFIETLRRYEAHLEKWMIPGAVKVSCAEMIRTGTTCFADQYFFADAILAEFAKSGLRAAIAYGIVELGDEVARKRELEETSKFLELCKEHELIDGWVGPHAFFVDNSLEIIAEEIALAKKHDTGFHIHFATNNEENDYCRERFGMSAAQKMKEIGILDIPIIAAHSITIPEEDMQLLAEHSFSPVTAPSASLRSGFPVAQITNMQGRGMTVGMGTDCVCNSNSYDMFQELGTLGKMIIHSTGNSAAITPREVVRIATRGSAEALGMDDKIGSLEPGKQADLIALDLSDIGWAPRVSQDYYTQIVYSVDGKSVTDTMVAGRWLMRDNTMQTVDYETATGELEAACAELNRRLDS